MMRPCEVLVGNPFRILHGRSEFPVPDDCADDPPAASRLSPKDTQPPPRTQTSVKPTCSSLAPTESPAPAPAKPMLSNLPALLLASTAGIPTSGNLFSQHGLGTLLSTRDPLYTPIATVNFRRLMSKVGAIFWLRDRIEEVFIWKRGWKVTSAWMTTYVFFCQFLFLRHVQFSRVTLELTSDTQVSSRGDPPHSQHRTPCSPSSSVRRNCRLASQPARNPEPHGFRVRYYHFFSITARSEYVRSSDVADDATLPFLPYSIYQNAARTPSPCHLRRHPASPRVPFRFCTLIPNIELFPSLCEDLIWLSTGRNTSHVTADVER
jgi:hypothetical protein